MEYRTRRGFAETLTKPTIPVYNVYVIIVNVPKKN